LEITQSAGLAGLGAAVGKEEMKEILDLPQPCLSCLSNTGQRRISPGKTIYEGQYWLIEHAYPCGLIGWLVIVLRRHAEALHELTAAEWAELGTLQQRTATLLRSVLQCEKEYVMGIADVSGFKHVHFHVVAKPAELPDELVGTRIFAMLKLSSDKGVQADSIAEFCEQMNNLFISSSAA
jgi:diadenosine tetraphosphate (Ap4A) HIT family hydrolase